nr:EpsG family protein [Colwellia hornerae]
MICIESSKRSRKRSILPFILFFFTLLIIFSGLRSPGVSSDDQVYISIFNQFVKGGGGLTSSTNEYVFVIINQLISFITDDVFYLFLLFALLTAFFTIFSFVKASPFITISVLVYFSHVYLYRDMIQIRAGLSYAIFMLALVCFAKKNYKASIALWLSSTLIHFSSFLGVVVPIINKMKFSSKFVIYSFLFSLVFGAIGLYTPISFLLNNVNLGPLTAPIKTYILSRNEFNKPLGLLNPTTLKQCIWFFVFFYYREKLKYELSSDIYFKTYFLSVCILLIFADFSVFAARFGSFFAVSEFFLLAALVVVSKKNRRFLFSIIIGYCCMMASLNVFSKGLFDGFVFYNFG